MMFLFTGLLQETAWAGPVSASPPATLSSLLTSSESRKMVDGLYIDIDIGSLTKKIQFNLI